MFSAQRKTTTAPKAPTAIPAALTNPVAAAPLDDFADAVPVLDEPKEVPDPVVVMLGPDVGELPCEAPVAAGPFKKVDAMETSAVRTECQ